MTGRISITESVLTVLVLAATFGLGLYVDDLAEAIVGKADEDIGVLTAYRDINASSGDTAFRVTPTPPMQEILRVEGCGPELRFFVDGVEIRGLLKIGNAFKEAGREMRRKTDE